MFFGNFQFKEGFNIIGEQGGIAQILTPIEKFFLEKYPPNTENFLWILPEIFGILGKFWI